jgi:E3 ubiquitin-protein ligase RFWD2
MICGSQTSRCFYLQVRTSVFSLLLLDALVWWLDLKGSSCSSARYPMCGGEAIRPGRRCAGHRKAVSYVRYQNDCEVVSASTDSTLRAWNVRTCSPVCVYSGHTNEKNFVGLSADGEFVACGSETNEVFVYHKALSSPMAKRLFSMSPATSRSGQELGQFISAVCWKPCTQTLVTANSQGTIKIMELCP